MNVLVRSCCRLVAVLMLLVGLAAATGSAQAQGNSGAAHKCQKGGYQHLYRSDGSGITDGSGFRNAGECTSYAAQGGVFYEVDPSISAESYLDFVLMYTRLSGQGFSPNGDVVISFPLGNATHSQTTTATQGGDIDTLLYPPLNCFIVGKYLFEITALDVKSGQSAQLEHEVVCPAIIDGFSYPSPLSLSLVGTAVVGAGFTPGATASLTATRPTQTVTASRIVAANGRFDWIDPSLNILCSAAVIANPALRTWQITAETPFESVSISHNVPCPATVTLEAVNYPVLDGMATTVQGEGFSQGGTVQLEVNGVASTIQATVIGTFTIGPTTGHMHPVDCDADPDHVWTVHATDVATGRSASVTNYPCGEPAP
jgi:hypothetical protein